MRQRTMLDLVDKRGVSSGRLDEGVWLSAHPELCSTYPHFQFKDLNGHHPHIRIPRTHKTKRRKNNARALNRIKTSTMGINSRL